MATVLPSGFSLPHAFLSGENPTLASQDNFQRLEEHLQYIWRAWTPTYTNITVGNGTVSARYVQIGPFVMLDWYLTFGSTSSMGTGPKVSLPVTA